MKINWLICGNNATFIQKTFNIFFTKKINIFETDMGKVPVDVSRKENILSGGVIGGTVRKRRESDPDQD